MATSRICSIPGCGKTRYSRGWCQAHYARWIRHKDPLIGGNLIPRAPTGEALRYFREVVLAYDGTECLTWPYSRNSSGYGQLNFDGRPQTVSHLACKEAHGEPPSPKHEAAHSCGNGHKACVTKCHLSWKTRAGNVADTLVHGTRSRGERNGQAKLTKDDVVAMRALEGRLTHDAIGTQFGVTRATAGAILTRKSWAWLE